MPGAHLLAAPARERARALLDVLVARTAQRNGPVVVSSKAQSHRAMFIVARVMRVASGLLVAARGAAVAQGQPADVWAVFAGHLVTPSLSRR
jgi:hypothetical protein